MGSSLPCGGSATAPPPPPPVPVRHLVRLPHFFPPATKAHTAATTSIGRRSSFVFPYLLFFSFSSSSPAATSLLSLEYFTDQDKGFAVLRPSSWIQVEKAGATALFEEGKGRNNIGVVVSPVRLSSLKEFGTPEFVANKLIQAERKKESTANAELIKVDERLGHSGVPIYEFEYLIDNTRRGKERIFSAAFVASKKLYLLNIAYSDRPDNPLAPEMRLILEQVLHSFDTL
ncbi:psbP domain-containing protein 2, chloroplastic-like [Zingiber officinale]|uniref:psbP domain-containing protein 2, chloroplastic-like n=1 Tax=Zingiber officinale TaxID=94328 RepID=UPI001C4AE7F2|nr:psbP domain-containing protein 2, chloroplastic-like [Zingiber officinale]